MLSIRTFRHRESTRAYLVLRHSGMHGQCAKPSLLEFTQLDNKAYARVTEFSNGMKRRLTADSRINQ